MSSEGLHLVKDDTDPSAAAVETLLMSPLMQRVEYVGTRDGGIVDCWVPTELVDHEEVPVKEEWARSLAHQMQQVAEVRGGSGQLSPVILGMISGEESLKIMDGFHRDAALKLNGEKRVYSAVQLTDWDGLYDVRIFTAKDHAHVRFSRVVQWIREVWAHSGIDDKMSLEQAIILYRHDLPGTHLKLDPDDVESAKAWVGRKEKQWDMAAMSIHSYLKIAETVDPGLVHATREKSSSDELQAPTQAILKVFAKELPDNFDLQNLVMQAAMAHNLKGPEVKALCDKIVGQNEREARATLAKVNFKDLTPSYSPSTQRSLRRAHDVRHKGADVFSRVEWEIDSISRRAQMSIENGEEVDAEMAVNIQSAIGRISELQELLGKTSLRLAWLLGEEGQQTQEAPIDLPIPEPEPVEVQEPQPAVEVSEEDSEPGIRQDLLAYLSGQAGISTVRPFKVRQLVECFNELNGRKAQPKGWRDRFAHIQTKILSQGPKT